jgi:putative Mg2+ transporter-C (MgtC) family protein
MPLTLEWPEIAIRLILTAIAGAVIGLNRGGHGHPAGLRTTLLVSMAASIAMIQTNLLLATVGRPADSFVMMDVMRLPLGILSGMGFIGGGVILKRDNLVIGITTAATLWFVTVIGMCFGGGQKVLGAAGLAIGVLVLWALKSVETRMPVDRTGSLIVSSNLDAAIERQIHRSVRAANFHIIATSMTYDTVRTSQEIRCDVRWHAIATEAPEPPFLSELTKVPGIAKVVWNPQIVPSGLP